MLHAAIGRSVAPTVVGRRPSLFVSLFARSIDRSSVVHSLGSLFGPPARSLARAVDWAVARPRGSVVSWAALDHGRRSPSLGRSRRGSSRLVSSFARLLNRRSSVRSVVCWRCPLDRSLGRSPSLGPRRRLGPPHRSLARSPDPAVPRSAAQFESTEPIGSAAPFARSADPAVTRSSASAQSIAPSLDLVAP